ncbi:MAG: branched-subunit amino acid transport protein [Planctomycetota bacterium]|jgi:branched-subunit amino acid transport protein
MTAMPPDTRPKFALLTLLALVMIGATLRVYPSIMTTDAQGIDIREADTVRRLVRINNLDESPVYPDFEPRDGYPEGAHIQWSLPMDWLIRAIDFVVPKWHENARPYETGAVLAGPLMGTLTVLAFALLIRRILPGWQATLAAFLYAVSGPGVEVTRLGNGDHQSLQDFCIVVALLGCMALILGKAGKRLAITAGVALGLSLWVNAESMIALGINGLMILAGLSFATREQIEERLPNLIKFAGAAVVVALTGQLIESNGALTLEWDRISCFQGASMLGLLIMVWCTRVFLAKWQKPIPALAAAAGVAGVMALGPFLLITGLRETLAAEIARAATFTTFARPCVAEYKRLFANGIGLAQLVYGFTLYLLPICFLGLIWAKQIPTSLRVSLFVPIVLLGALVVDQVKLSHMFCIVEPLLLICGGIAVLDFVHRRFGMREDLRKRLHLAGGVLLAVLAAWHILSLTLASTDLGLDTAATQRRALVAAVKNIEFAPKSELEAERIAFMAPWDIAHYILYGTDKSIIASSYQRRVDGIRDSFEVMCSQNPAEAVAILKRRKARWFIRPGDPSFLLQYHQVVPGRKMLGEAVIKDGEPRTALDQAVLKTLWSHTAKGKTLPDWLELEWESKDQTTWWESFAGPSWRVFRIRYPDEG